MKEKIRYFKINLSWGSSLPVDLPRNKVWLTFPSTWKAVPPLSSHEILCTLCKCLSRLKCSNPLFCPESLSLHAHLSQAFYRLSTNRHLLKVWLEETVTSTNTPGTPKSTCLLPAISLPPPALTSRTLSLGVGHSGSWRPWFTASPPVLQ